MKLRRASFLATTIASLLPLCQSGHTAALDAIWLGGSGQWDAPVNWSGGVIPNLTATDEFNVFIDSLPGTDSIVTLGGPLATAFTITVRDLTIDAGDKLVLAESAATAKLTLTHAATNGGELVVKNRNQILLNGEITIGGAGITTIDGGSITADPAFAGPGASHLIIGTDQTVRLVNNGIIGETDTGVDFGNLKLTNSGTIEVSGPAATQGFIILHPHEGLTNTGIIRATGQDSILRIKTDAAEALDPELGVEVLNTGSILADGAEAVVMFDGATLTGAGTTTADNSGAIIFSGQGGARNTSVEAVNGGRIQIGDNFNVGMPASGRFDNVTFTADGNAGSYIEINGGEFFEGPLTFKDVTFDGPVGWMTTHGEARLQGTLTNIGTISGDPFDPISGFYGGMFIDGPVTLDGGGTIIMGDSMETRISGDEEGADPDTNELIIADQTIRGSGVIGAYSSDEDYGGLRLSNHGTIHAEGDMVIILRTDTGMLNTGMLRAGDYNEGGSGVLRIKAAHDDAPDPELGVELMNDGEILADGPEAIVLFDGATLTGTGTTTADNGGRIVFIGDSGAHDTAITAQNEGVIKIGDRSNFVDPSRGHFTNVTFTADALSDSWIGVYSEDFDSGPLTFDDVIFDGNTGWQGQTRLRGTFTNIGTISAGPMAPMGFYGTMFIDGAVTLDGGGTIVMGDFGESRITGDNDGFDPDSNELIIQDQTIRGSGVIGNYDIESLDNATMRLTNHGTIQSDGDLALVLRADAGMLNTGMLRAGDSFDGNSGVLRILADGEFAPDPELGVELVNEGAILADGFESIVMFDGATLTGPGTTTADNEGTILFNGGRYGFGRVARNTSVLAQNGGRIFIGDNDSFGFGTRRANGLFENVVFTVDGANFSDSYIRIHAEDDIDLLTFKDVTLDGPVEWVGPVRLQNTLTNYGLISDDASAPGDGIRGGMFIDGVVTLDGGGTGSVIIGNLSRIVGDPDGTDPALNELINLNHTIRARGNSLIGTDDPGALPGEGTLKIRNQGEIIVTEGGTLTIIPNAGGVINEGRIIAENGSSVTVRGNFTQTASGELATHIAQAGIRGTDYSYASVTGDALLGGTFRVDVGAGYTPVVGDSFNVLDYGQRLNGNTFVNYVGFVLAGGKVLRPTYNTNNLTLTVENLSPGTDAPLVPVAPGSSEAVATGESYAGIITTSAVAGGNSTVATILDGSASGSTSIALDYNTAGTFGAGSGGTLASDVLSLSGTGGDKFVLQMDYNEAAVLAYLSSENDMFLSWFDGTAWVNAILGNSNGGVGGQKFYDAYDPLTDFELGYYGVDTLANRVWAVIDHNSMFGASGVITTSLTPYQQWAAENGLAGESAAASADVEGDGIVNLIEFASNLDPLTPDAAMLTPGTGTAGQPNVALTGSGPTAKLVVEFVRRIGSGIEYAAEFSDTLGVGSWAETGAAPVITPIDANWERVSVEDSFTVSAKPRRFARVRVSEL